MLVSVLRNRLCYNTGASPSCFTSVSVFSLFFSFFFTSSISSSCWTVSTVVPLQIETGEHDASPGLVFCDREEPEPGRASFFLHVALQEKSQLPALVFLLTRLSHSSVCLPPPVQSFHCRSVTGENDVSSSFGYTMVEK